MVQTWADGTDYLTTTAATRPHGSFAGFGWKVVARQPFATTMGSVRTLQFGFLAGGMLIGLLAAVLAWWMTGRLVMPLRRLADAAERAEPGQAWADSAHDQHETGEVVAVKRALARLADSARSSADASSTSVRQFEALASSLPQLVWQADTPRWFDIRAQSVVGVDRHTRRWVGTIFDIDEIASLAAATHRALEEEKSARADADRLARLRDEFLATVSHELRSPLNAIAGWSEILARKRTDDPMIAKASQSICRNARQQAVLIDDLMDMTAVMAGKMVLRRSPVDLAQSAKNVFLSHIHAAQEKGVELVCRDMPSLWVMGEARRLEQVLSNLVGNAIKFTDSGGQVVLEVRSEAGEAVVQVRDSGRGIAPDFLPHVFERMRQEDGSVTCRSGGLGLGLAIARGIVELHGGRITADSAGTGRGAALTAYLPVAEMSLATADTGALADDDRRSAIGTELQGLRVLLVDDEADAREVAHVALAGFGADVRAVGSAAEVLDILETERYDVLVSDIGMPTMDGLTLIRTLRALPHGSAAQLPAVALTAFSMETDVRAGKEAGFQGYVGKPISLHGLYTAIVVAMRR